MAARESGRRMFRITIPALADVMARRRSQARFRLVVAGLMVAVYGSLLGWITMLSWLAPYAILQGFEAWYFSPARLTAAGGGSRHSAGRRSLAALMLLVANSTVFGAMPLLAVLQLGTWGEVCAAYLLSGAILNTVVTTTCCRAALYASMLPFTIYSVLIPLTAIYDDQTPGRLVVVCIAISGVLLSLSALKLWHGWTSTKLAEAAAIVRDIEARNSNEDRLSRLAHLDTLTGLGNRAALHLRLGEMIDGRTAGALLVVDLDGFKFVNDTLGHSAGDRVLREVASRIVACSRPDDVIARLGGDEFAVLLPEALDQAEAADISARIIADVSRPVAIDGQLINVGASIGIALHPMHGGTAEELFSNADLALYQAKGEGRNCSRLYEPALRAVASARLSRDAELCRALEGGELRLFYQPQIRLRDGRVTGAEALLRWLHPEQGLLLPGAFITALEGSRLAVQAGDWVLGTACRQAALWREQGLPDFQVAVNLFGAQFRSGDLAQKVLDVLARSGLAADGLEIEITENVILRHEDAIIAPLRELRRRGVGVAFDDYGTGFASLSLLKRYPLSRLKIDRSFTQSIVEDAADATIVRAITSMAGAFDLRVTAEGVETERQAALVEQCGCDDGQGFLYGPAISADAFTQRFVTSSEPAVGPAAGGYRDQRVAQGAL